MVQALLTLFLLVGWVRSSDVFALDLKRKEFAPCPQIRLMLPDDVVFSDTEIRLLCGDSDPSRTGRAWSNIPITQAQVHFRTFLQDRGYFFPVYRERPDGSIEFDPGQPTFVVELLAPGLPQEVPMKHYGAPLGALLTPSRVSAVGDWVRRRMLEEGWPCPEIETTASAETGVIEIKWLNPGPPSTIDAIVSDSALDLAFGAIRRYDAFRVGQRYSYVRTEITSRRTTADRLVFSQDLEPQCDTAPAHDRIVLKETIQAGAPRLVTFAVGANTESGPLGSIAWSHTRLGRAGSMAELSARASFLEQSILARGDWYFHETSSRKHLSPMIEFAHEDENHFELIALRSFMFLRTGSEFENASIQVGMGIGWQNLQQIAGIGPLNSRFGTFEAVASYLSHRFEYYSDSPRSGQNLSMSTTVVPDPIAGIGSPLRLRFEGTALWNPGDFDPPWVVLGVRSRAFWTYLSSNSSRTDTPIEFREWLGGGQDVRGFGRRELPANDWGSTRGVSVGTEMRFPRLLLPKLEPFLLLDAAWLRSGPSVDTEVAEAFWSPGFGLRWESPVGSVRGSLAHGYQIGSSVSLVSHWQIYLSLGEEF